MEEHEPEVTFLKRRVSRRQAIKAGGIAAVGLAFSDPLIRTIRPKPAFANYVIVGVACVLDVDNDPATVFNTNSTDPLSQSFKPQAQPLCKVELRLSGLKATEDEFPVTLSIREDSPSGTVVETSTAGVPRGPSTPITLVEFNFVPPVPLTTGNVYVLQLPGLSLEGIAWMVHLPGLYANGEAFAGDVPLDPVGDFNFRTFAVQ